jgi:hypothetical protein
MPGGEVTDDEQSESDQAWRSARSASNPEAIGGPEQDHGRKTDCLPQAAPRILHVGPMPILTMRRIGEHFSAEQSRGVSLLQREITEICACPLVIGSLSRIEHLLIGGCR